LKKLLILWLVVSLSSLFVGVGDVSISALLKGDQHVWQMVWISRIPRYLAIVLSGAGLSIAGLIMQQISQNRFAAPSTSGTIECAMLGYILSLVIFGDGDHIGLIFLTSIVGTLVFVFLIHSIQFKNSVFVPLVGIIFGNVIQAGAFFLAYRYDAVQSLLSWTVANFASILDGNFELLYLAIPISLLSYAYASRISAVGMGRDFAVNLGLNYHQVVVVGVVLVATMSATVVMIVGQLPFLGLIVPNLVSLFYGDDLRKNIPKTALLGATLVLVCDVAGRVIIYPYEIPISLLISILGGVTFILFIIKGRQYGS
jgi:iron complex transport system permease protein